MIGTAFALAALAFLGTTACSTDAPSAETGMTTTAADGSETSDDQTSDSETSDGETPDGETSTSTSTDTGDSASDTSQSGGSFYAGPAPADLTDTTQCGLWEQDCPEGEKCVPFSTDGGNVNGTKCVLVTGDGMAGEACTYAGTTEATDNCNEHTACWNRMDVDGQSVGTCTEFCSGSPDEPICPVGSTCLNASETLAFCLDDCDPLAQDCAEGLGCYWASSAFLCVFQTEDLAEGEPCSYINDCEPGQWCTDAELLSGCAGWSCCTGFCSLSNPTCAPEHECSPFLDQDLPDGYEDVGVCLKPS